MTTPPRMYGIWQPGLGWVKAYKKGGGLDVYATLDKTVAKDVARRIGDGARVEYIDDALAMMETELIKSEARVKWWQVWRWVGIRL
jgi:hypothetical protein